MVRRERKSYVCHACRDGHHALCIGDLNPKKVCTCDKVWHVDMASGRRFKGTVWEPERR